MTPQAHAPAVDPQEDEEGLRDRLRSAVEDTAAGRGGLVLVAAHSDVARIVSEAVADHRGVRTAHVRCRRGRPAFAPWLHVLQRLDAETPLPGARFRRLELLARTLADAVRAAPVVVVLDVLHEADGASLLLLERLASDWPVGLAVIAVHRAVDLSDPLATTLAELALEPCVTSLVSDDEGRADLPAPEADDCVFRCEGDYWRIAFDGVDVRVRDLRGYHYLATLLRQPGERIHVCDVLRRVQGRAAHTGEDDHDAVVAERTRLTVTKGIRLALSRLRAAHPLLGRHLGATVRCGYFCTYAPDPRFPIRWRE